jgi:Ca2+-binding EF-hand superfamily protein
MSALLAAQSESSEATSSASAATTASTSRSNALKDLFKLLDGDGDGQISKSEFEDKLGAGGTNTANADSVFSKLDTDGDESVSMDELSVVTRGRNANASYNYVEQLIQRRAEAQQAAAASTLSVSA